MKKNILLLGLIASIIAVIIIKSDFQTVSEHNELQTQSVKENSKTVFISINYETVLDNLEALDEDVAKQIDLTNGELLKKTEYVINDKDTVFDVLQRAVKDNNIQLEYEGAADSTFGSAYIEGINYLYEFSCGVLSGWMYKVNGEFANYGCSKYVLKDKDVIEWVYTCNLGEDVGAEFEN